MNHKSQPTFIAWRFYLLLSVILLAVAGLIWRVFDLAILDQHFLQREGDERVLRLESAPPFRGMIVDRNGSPLAVSTRVYSVWINPKDFSPPVKEAKAIAKLLGMKASKLHTLAGKNKKTKREFVYLKRGQPPETAAAIKALHVRGLYTQEEYRRYYPEGEVTAHVVGFTNIDDQGQEGLELEYNQWLAGEPGKKWVIKDRLGQVISDVKAVQEQKPGRDVVLSIDRRIQYLAYRELLSGVIRNRASAGSVVVLDTKTGEVLAMVNQPSFNPNSRPIKLNDNIRNRAVTDIFEPGSTIKAFSVATALTNGVVKPNTVIDTYPGWLRIGHNILKDEKNNGPLTVTQILRISSSVGVAKMMLNVPPDQLWDVLHRVGLGEITNVGFPGEQSGSLIKHHPWGSFTFATLAIGYGVSVTALQLANAYNVLANEGMKMPVSLLRVDKPPATERVIDARVAKEVLMSLESVLSKGGTGELATVSGYRVAGKTGTARMVGEHGYQKQHHTSSFVGIAPLTHPRLVVAVIIHDPQGGNYLGGLVSAPVFANIMTGALRILDVPPDGV